MSPASPLVVEAVRGEVVESHHPVDVAIVDRDGMLRAWAGEPATVAYLRSASKPIQATVCVEAGWTPPGVEQLAVACASHNGESSHVEAVHVTLTAATLDEDALRCPAEAKGRIYHNCSGKHAAMLAACVASGLPSDTYLDADHELQRSIRARVEEIAGLPSRAEATDGCGVPTFAFTLAEMATMYARLPARAPGPLDAMRAHPFLIAGSHRICTAVMSLAPGLVLKVGAEGLMCGVHVESRTAFALKSRDGSARGREIATIRVLQMNGYLDETAAGRVLKDIEPRIQAGPGRHPELRCRGGLERA